MSDVMKKFELLNDEEKDAFLDGLKTYLAYNEEASESKKAANEQVGLVASKLKNSLSKKEVKRFFSYFKKNTQPIALREDADIIESIKNKMQK